jgi:hypothetical protein
MFLDRADRQAGKFSKKSGGDLSGYLNLPSIHIRVKTYLSYVDLPFLMYADVY